MLDTVRDVSVGFSVFILLVLLMVLLILVVLILVRVDFGFVDFGCVAFGCVDLLALLLFCGFRCLIVMVLIL